MAPFHTMDPARWQQIERLYHRAQTVASGDRAAFLADACAGDEPLRQEVQALLDAPVTAEGFLDTPPPEMAAAGIVGPTMLTGLRLGVYHVQEQIGAGGMGEVYRARDTRLGRDVAIKILPAAFTADPDRLARFEREARVLAALNHPNIAAIYGVEDGPPDAGHHIRGLVLELVHGETLAERITRGPVPVRETLGFATQIADALDAAHEKGIVHRDLKPGNIKIMPGGAVKVLDFGLAKAAESDAGGDVHSQAPTVTVGGTREGLILGTAAYMSPEQARGQAVDKRTDVWAFGCVLYEMLTGRAVFAGATISDTIASILEHEPDWNALPRRLAPGIQRLLRRCLDKERNRRLRDIGEARYAINRAIAAQSSAVSAVRSRLTYVIVGVAAIALVSAAVAVWRTNNSTMLTSRVEPITAFPDSAVSPAFSPDGRMVAFIRGPSTFIGSGQIYVKVLPDGEPMALTRDGHRKMHPVFSPDGSRVAYTVSADNLAWDTWVVPLVGGQPKPWLPNASGLSWIDRQRLCFRKSRTTPFTWRS